MRKEFAEEGVDAEVRHELRALRVDRAALPDRLDADRVRELLRGLVEYVQAPLGPGTRFDSMLFSGLDVPVVDPWSSST